MMTCKSVAYLFLLMLVVSCSPAVQRVPGDGLLPTEAAGIRDCPSVGPEHAPVTMVEFTDFQCPFCGRAAETVERLQADYGANLRVVVCQNPLAFHPQAMPAARAALAAAAQGKYAQYSRLLFDNARGLDDAKFVELAQQLGLDVEQFNTDRASAETEAKIVKQQKLAAGLGARGVPAFFVNGQTVTGARPYGDFKVVIEEQLARAKELIESGVPVRRIHSRVVRETLDGDYFRYVVLGEEPVARVPKHDPHARVEPLPLAAEAVEIPVSDSPRLGTGDKVVIVVFSDFQCPYCGKVDPALREVAQHYGPDGSFVFKHFPLNFHVRAMPAAQAAQAAAAQGKFWEFTEKMFANRHALEDVDLDRYAAETGLDVARFRAEMDSGLHKTRVEQDVALAAQLNVRGTPTIYINGRQYQGPREPEKMIKIIDEELLKK